MGFLQLQGYTPRRSSEKWVPLKQEGHQLNCTLLCADDDTASPKETSRSRCYHLQAESVNTAAASTHINISKENPQPRVPVATKHCHCGHQFFEERRRSTTSTTSELEELEDGTLKDMKPSRGVATSSSVSGMMAMASSVGKGDLGSPAPEGKRRSERVKREKPNFYDSLEYDNQMRKARKERQKEVEPPNPTGRVKRERKVKNNSEPDDDDDDEPVKEKKKKKKKKNNNNNGEKKEEEVDEDIMTGISAEKEKQYAIVLSDINFKLGLNNPKFIKI